MKILFVISFLFLVSCGGGSSSSTASNNSGEPSTQTVPELKNFEVQGTGSVINNVIQLDSNKGNNFSVSLKINAADSGKTQGYGIELYLSDDAKYSPEDHLIYSKLCQGKQCVGEIDYSIQCSFNKNSQKMQFSCTGNGARGRVVLDKSFINSLPKSTHLLLVLSGAGLNDYKVYSKKTKIY